MMNVAHPKLVICPSKAFAHLFTKLRGKKLLKIYIIISHYYTKPFPFFRFSFIAHKDIKTDTEQFVIHAKRALRILAEDAIAELPSRDITISTPCSPHESGILIPTSKICAISIVRSGDAIVEALRECITGLVVGKILIQRDENSFSKSAIDLGYSKLPDLVSSFDAIFLCDPMLASGGSAVKAIDILCNKYNLREHTSKIVFVNLICCPEGLEVMAKTYPEVKIVTACIDSYLNDDKYIVPGLGDFGDRFYGT